VRPAHWKTKKTKKNEENEDLFLHPRADSVNGASQLIDASRRHIAPAFAQDSSPFVFFVHFRFLRFLENKRKLPGIAAAPWTELRARHAQASASDWQATRRN
jgi:hypothetical protein